MTQNIWFLFYFLCGIGISSSLCQSNANGSTSETACQQQTTSTLDRYIMSNGGIIDAASINFHLDATLGQPGTGECSNTNYIVKFGFWNSTFIMTTDVSSDEQFELSGSFFLHQNYPNPFIGKGSPFSPYMNIKDALNKAPNGATLIFRAGTVNTFSSNTLVINRPLTLKGRNVIIRTQ